MIIKFTIFLFVLLTISDVKAEVYKCTSNSGKLSYSDMPCKTGDNKKIISVATHKSSWLEQLRAQKSSSIKIVKVTGSDNDVTIEYEFTSQSDSSDFMRKVNELSSLGVSLSKIIPASGNAFGRAVINVSDKENSFFNRMVDK